MASDKKDNDAPVEASQGDVAVGSVETAYEDDCFAVRVIEIPKSKWVRRYRSVAFQMVLLSLLSFSGPSMSNGE